MLAVVATLAAAPGVRARVEHWLGIGAVRVERVERLPATGPGRDLGLGPRTTLAGARRVARVRVPAVAALGPPDAVYADPRDGGASLVWRARPGLPAAGNGVGALLDNCEHLLSACAELAELILRSCPGVQILATSREGLNISGETTYRLETALGRGAALRLARSVR